MNSKLCQLLLAVATLAALAALSAWHNSSGAHDELRSRFVAGLLEPAAAMLTENQALIKELQAEAEKDGGILFSYLAKIRRDGVPKHATMRQRLDQIAYNNVAIAALLTAHAPYSRNPELQAEVDKFRKYAVAWRERWNTVMEVFMVGGTYASAELPFPMDLPDRVQAEMSANR